MASTYRATLDCLTDGSIHREALIQVGSSVDKVVGQIIAPNGYYALGLKVGT